MKTLRLTWWHLGLWLGLAVVAGVISLQACLRYNELAGTDKSPAHIVAITVAVLAGPLVGPVANPHPAELFKIPPTVLVATLVLLIVQGMALTPFVVVKRSVPTALFVAAWVAFITASSIWFGAALVSLGYFLS